jgi:hypothetical protein
LSKKIFINQFKKIKNMEFLGHSNESFEFNVESKKWKAITLNYEDVESYCEATSKLINGFKDECRFVIANEEGDRHFVNVLDYVYDTKNNKIKIFPEYCRAIKSFK